MLSPSQCPPFLQFVTGTGKQSELLSFSSKTTFTINCYHPRQRGAIERFQPTGLSTSIPLLPQLLKPAGYNPQCSFRIVDCGQIPTMVGICHGRNKPLGHYYHPHNSIYPTVTTGHCRFRPRYKTHAIGKWHLGFCDEKYLPTRYSNIYQKDYKYLPTR